MTTDNLTTAAETAHLEVDLIIEAIAVLAHYRTRVHVPTEHSGYLQVATFVSERAANAADQIIRVARQTGLLTTTDTYQ